MTLAISIVALVVSIIALVANVTELIRRPRIIAEWGDWQDVPPFEGLSITVTTRRRAIEVDEIGIVVYRKRMRKRRIHEWLHEHRPPRFPVRVQAELPRRLQDGESIRGYMALDHAIDEMGGPGVAYPYVRASGMVYLANDSKLRRRLRRRREER